MKSDFLKKFKAWSLLASVVLAFGCMTACDDDKEEIEPSPEPTPATYSISGTVYASDASTGLGGVTVELSGAKSASTTSASNGTYKFELGSTNGSFTVKFSKDGYKAVSVPVIISSIATGTIDYSVNAALVKDAGSEPEPEKTYKTPTYSLSISITDADGKAIEAEDLKVTVKGNDLDITKNESSFTLTNVKSGIYSVQATATGYDAASGKALVNAITEKVEGEGTFEVKTGATFVMKTATLTPAEAAYMISGKVTDTAGKALTSTITLSSSDESFTKQEWNASEFSLDKIDPQLVETGATFFLTVKADGYNPYSWTFKLNKVAAGQTWNEVINVVLSKVEVPSGGDGGGTGGGTTEEGTSSEVIEKFEPLAPKDLEQKEGVSEVVEGTTTIEGKEVATTEVKVETGKTVELGQIKATETDHDNGGTTKEVIDEISFTAPAGTTEEVKIVMPKEEGKSQALTVERQTTTESTVNKEQNIEKLIEKESAVEGGTTVTKDDLVKPATEVTVKVAAVERIFEGGPDGTQFVGAPLTIASPAPTGIVAESTELPMALLTSTDGIVWTVADPEKDGTASCVGGVITTTVKHFSKFAPGFAMSIKKIDSSNLYKDDQEKTNIANDYIGKMSSKSEIIIKSNVEKGLAYTTADGGLFTSASYDEQTLGKAVFADLKNATATKEYLFKKLLDKIKADNGGMYPTSGAFAKESKEFKVPVEKNKTFDSFILKTTYIVKVYSITVGTTEYKIGVKSVQSQEITVTYKAGHAHGDDINAGGGIVDFE